MLEGFSGAIIEGETSWIRFERFCLAMCERIEGTTFVPTSFNYDQARDARSTNRVRAFVCATLNKAIEAKVEVDLAKLNVTSEPERLIYCSSQRLTEREIDHLEGIMRRLVPANCSITTLSAIQLADLAERNRDIFDRFYVPTTIPTRHGPSPTGKITKERPLYGPEGGFEGWMYAAKGTPESALISGALRVTALTAAFG